MTHAARLTQKRLEGEILKLLEGERAILRSHALDCAFCRKYDKHPRCKGCPLAKCYPGLGEGCYHGDFNKIANDMYQVNSDAILGALAIYLWLFEL